MSLENKKILLLGGKPIGSTEIVNRAHELGIYVIVTDFLSKEESPAKQLADESWDVSTAELNTLFTLCKENCVDGIISGVHEFNINQMLDLCSMLNKPCYCRKETWKYCDNKIEFKKLCIQSNIPVAHKYEIDFTKKSQGCVSFPVIVKPVDGSGSRGFHICKNYSELIENYKLALTFSLCKQVLIEEYIPLDSVIIHYTMHQGKCYYSGISDKYSATFPSTGASVMGLQIFPSKGELNYLNVLNKKVIAMFEKAGFTDGPIWIEAFYDGKEMFIFNEMGYRLGGSMTNYPVQFFYDIDQLSLIITKSLGIDYIINARRRKDDLKYCILPIHIKPGTITKIIGQIEIKEWYNINAFVPVHFKGDKIQDWGSAQQVYCYLHIIFKTNEELKASINEVMKTLKVYDSNDNNMLFTLYNIK